MLFKKLEDMLASCKHVAITIAPATGGKLAVTVIPAPKEDAPALATPLSLTGTAAELDEKFVDIVGNFSDARTDLEEQLAATKAVIDAATKESAGKAAKAVKKTDKSAEPKAAPVAPQSCCGGDEDGEDGGDANSCAMPTPASAGGDASALNLFV